MKQKYLTLLGIIGLDFIFLGAMLSWILSEFVFLAKLSLFLGILMIIVWAALSHRRTTRFFGKRIISRGTSSILGFGFFMGFIVILNVLGVRYNVRRDTTAEKLYSLSDQTLKVISMLENEIEIILFDNPDLLENREAAELIEEYSIHSVDIGFRIIDPDRNPQPAKKYGIATYGQAVVLSGDKAMLIENPTEEELTNAIKSLVIDVTRKVFFLTGHGEISPYSAEPGGYSELKRGIEFEGFGVDTLNLIVRGYIPQDAAVLIIAGPQTDPGRGEFSAISKYFETGGKILVLLEPGDSDSIRTWLSKYGVAVGDNLVIDNSSTGKAFGASPEMPLIVGYDANHPLTKGFDAAMMFPTVRSVAKADTIPENFHVRELAVTSETAFGETNWQIKSDGFTVGADIAGPVPVIVSSENLTKKPTPRMLVLGDPDFCVNRYIDFAGNRDFILNTVDWLGKNENLISIRAKDQRDSKLLLTAQQQQQIFYISVVGLPFLALLLAEIAWWRKNSKSKK